MSLCEQCHSISARVLKRGSNELFRNDHGSFRKAVFEKNCYICYRVWESLSKEQKKVASRPEFTGIKYSILLRDTSNTDIEPDIFLPDACLADISFLPGDDLYDCEDYNDVGGPHLRFEGEFTILNPAVFPVEYALKLAKSTDDPSCWALAAQWINLCSSTHSSCRESCDEGWKPTRLVDVAEFETGYVRVVESSAINPRVSHERYLALSHCWGVRPFLIMNKSNKKEFERGVLISSLPLNFQDAILTTRKLGFRYIWIDSLCIIQDSRDDWERQAPLMNKVYKNAFVTIGATASTDAHGGLFRTREPEMASPLPINIQTEQDGKIECVLIQSSFWETQVRRSPLSQRGWVVQERVLSPRSLYFCESQLFWECRELHACEWFPLGIPLVFVTDIKEPLADNVVSVKAFEKSITRVSDATGVQQYENVYQVWGDILESYSRGHLTQPDDKLVAISGITKEFAKAVDDEYIAGLWRRNLINGLLWTARPEFGFEYPVANSTRPGRYRAPSWSWASLDAPSLRAYRHQENLFYGDYVQVSDAHVEPKGDDPTGELRHACLHLSGRLVKLRHKPRLSANLPLFGNFCPDVEETAEAKGYYGLPLREEPGDGDDGPCLRGLVLTPCIESERESMTSCRKCAGEVVFRRVGAFICEQGEPLRYLSMIKPHNWAEWGDKSDHLWFPEDSETWDIIIV